VTWSHTIEGLDPSGFRVFASTVLANGSVAVAFNLVPVPGSLDDPSANVALVSADGQELWRTSIPAITVESALKPGTGSPGLGVPYGFALSETLDGGLFLAGTYSFNRSIECGTQDDPKDPVTSACGSSVRNGLVARLDSGGQLLWTKRLGAVYQAGDVVLEHAAALDDGSLLTAGWQIPEKAGDEPLHMQAIAARYDASGNLSWANAYPFGRAPGATFFAGTSFDGLNAVPGAAADVILRTPQNGCTLLRIGADAEITRLQFLPGVACTVGFVGSDIGYYNGVKLAKLAP
jgi:hypothetical protein